MANYLKSLSDFLLPHQIHSKKKVFLLSEGSAQDENLLSTKGYYHLIFFLLYYYHLIKYHYY